MSAHRFLQMDVFSNEHGMGNPLAVVVDADGWSSAQMQRFAHWTNLSESAFLLTPTAPGADYRVRIFTPRRELPFAGHPSVGAAYAALHSGKVSVDRDSLVQECAAGLLPVGVNGAGPHRKVQVRAPDAAIRMPTPHELPVLHAALAGAGQVQSGSLRHVDNGPRWWLAELADETAVRKLPPDLSAIAQLCHQSDSVGLCVYARTGCDDPAYVVRAFCPADGINEDPVTGSANAAIAAVVHANGGLNRIRNTWWASQGREVGRDGRVELTADRDGGVWIGGHCRIAIDGVLEWT